MRAAAFLDRDGVINIDHGYVWRREDFEFVPGTLAACAELHRRGLELVVVTNQSGIGRGLYTEADFQALTQWMRGEFAAAGAPLAGVYHCPHRPPSEGELPGSVCDCRKPAPGMLLRAARELSIDLGQSVLFGDKRSDLQAAMAAGVPDRVLLGKDGTEKPAQSAADLATASFKSLADAVAGAAVGARKRVAQDG